MGVRRRRGSHIGASRRGIGKVEGIAKAVININRGWKLCACMHACVVLGGWPWGRGGGVSAYVEFEKN
jgi:hypothetical protein